MPHAAHTLLRGIRIDVEPANADHPSIEPRPEEPFAGSIEAAREVCVEARFRWAFMDATLVSTEIMD